jgi:hypothetical protein
MNRRRVTVATGAVTAAAVVAVLPVITASPAPAQTSDSCSILEVTGSGSTGGTHLVERELPSDHATAIRTLHDPVNAIGAAADLTYGVGAQGHIVTIDRTGHEEDLGLPKGSHSLAGATAGTVVGHRWYVRAGSTLYQVDVDPDSHAYLRITGAVRLWPASLAANLDDLDARPGSGSLYGVAQPDRWHGVVVRVDPLRGKVTPVRGDLPGGSAYGAVSFGPDGALYARQNDIAGRSVRYRIPLHGGYPRVLDTRRAVGSSDATGCLPAPPPPPTTTTTTPPPTTTTTTTPPPPPPTTTTPPPTTTTTPPPPPTTTTTPRPTTTTVVPLAIVLPPPPTTTVPPTTPPPTTPPPTTTTPPATTLVVLPPPPVATDDPLPTSEAIPVADVTERTQQRRWGLTALLLIIGGAAAGSRMRSSRRAGR